MVVSIADEINLVLSRWCALSFVSVIILMMLLSRTAGSAVCSVQMEE